MSLSALRSKRTVNDIWPVRYKRFFVLTDPQNIIGETTDGLATLTTISYLLEREAAVVVASSFGDLKGIPLSFSRGQREEAIEIFRTEGGMGYTNYFNSLPINLKAEVLKVANGCETPVDSVTLSPVEVNGAFAALSIRQKAAALHNVFPRVEFSQCSTYAFVRELTNRFPTVPVKFSPDPLNAPISQLKPGEILVLENLKFYQNEISPNHEERVAMAEVLASYCDYCVNESFATVCAVHASNTELPKILYHGAAGFSMEKELAFFLSFLAHPPRPIVVVVAGRQSSKKLRMIRSLVGKVDKILVAGALIMPFLAAKGLTTDKSFNNSERVERRRLNEAAEVEELSVPCVGFAQEIITLCEKNGVELVFPVDHVVTRRITKATEDSAAIVESIAVPSDVYAVDCSANTIALFTKCIRPCQCVFWTGTFGCTRMGYSEGTYAFARALAQQGKLSIVSGNSTACVVRQLGLTSQFSHISSGGSTCLDALQGHHLPGVEMLSDIPVAVDVRSCILADDLLRSLPLFSNCSSHQLKAVAQKFVRRVHACGDYLTYYGDKHACMWVVASGGLVARSGDTTLTLPSRYIGRGQTVGMYGFITQSFATDTIQAAEDETVTYQLTFSSLQDLFNEQSDLAAQLLQNVSETLRVMAIEEYREQSSIMNVLRRAALCSRFPTFLAIPKDWGFMEDVIQDIISGTVLSGITQICTGQTALSSPRTFSLGLGSSTSRGHMVHCLCRVVLRDLLYHKLIEYGIMPATCISSIILSPFRLRAMGMMWSDVTCKAMLDEALLLAVEMCSPIAAHGTFLVVQRRIEVLLRRKCATIVKFFLTALVDVGFGFVLFPLTFHRRTSEAISLPDLFRSSVFKRHQWKVVLLLVLRCVVHVLLNGVRRVHRFWVIKRKSESGCNLTPQRLPRVTK
ncbi:phosphoglycerate kinase, putative [Trypanosoma brucei brucei TREU927]|uniref:Phosphoglycerate kinase n=1 Tax=Trypanosoma brucei brucei (strain 927/4 GUTat10.1) TaxID=185431 RepID=Q386S1_TRYB2|nr:phosphoglycerate kinase, putative [Trypanosoma brucei brucei TREU927]EAN79210.1 phosphoglycerate kinase, putative [Trypanosoma brucei brucei TREU927]